MNNSESRLGQLLDSDWKTSLQECPELATQVGVAEHADRWSDLSREAIERRRRRHHATLAALRGIERRRLSAPARLNYDLFERDLVESIEGDRFPSELLPLDQEHGLPMFVPRLIAMMPAFSTADYENIVARLRAVPLLVDQTLSLMKEGLTRGVTPSRVILGDAPRQLERQMARDPAESPMLAAFRQFPPSVPPAARARLLREGRAALEKRIFPAYRRLADFLLTRYLPRARRSTSWAELPDGGAWYAYRVKAFTTTGLTPAQLHELGESEVARIRGEMRALVKETGFKGDLAAFRRFLSTDPRFFHKDEAALLDGYRSLLKRIEPELVRLFRRLPRLPCGVTPVPPHIAKISGTAYYQGGSLEGGRPGWFFANTFSLKTRPKWEMEALALHEAVPGHHFQIALAQELEDVPPFRKYGSYTAFVEGWALYAESLGTELGLYTDPYSRMGRLAYEVFRAARLVVDTGLHAFGWSRRKAIDYLLENTFTTRRDAHVEIDYYIATPGQALSYKVGELAIRRLRDRAVAQLGSAFDLRAFHDRLLGEGAMPIDLLERRMDDWLSADQVTGRPGATGP